MKDRNASQGEIIRKAGLALGILCFFGVLGLLKPVSQYPHMAQMAAVALLMAVWWITEALPLATTALLPVVLFPLLGIMDGKTVAPLYINHIIFLFIGGFLIAIAMERWKLNRRIALRIIRLVGTDPARIVMGYMAATAFLSMWISNTATVVMMLPMAMAIILRLEQEFGQKKVHNFSVALMLGLAYSASLGGVATLIGTPPNLVFSRIFEITFPKAPAITFANWFLMALPLSLFLLVSTWLLLTKFLFIPGREIIIDRKIINEEYRKLKTISFEEVAVLAVSVLTAGLWMFRKPIPVGPFTVPGWSSLFYNSRYLNDGTVAIAMALALFFIPAHSKQEGGSGTLLQVESFQKIPWHIIILFGGGFALAQGIRDSGLSAVIAGNFQGLGGASPLVVIMTICGTITLVTELTSNTATVGVTLPILASIAVAMKVNPLFLMMPATISASFAFMMPVATPPNAVVYGSGRLRIGEMVRAGIYINILSVVCATIAVYFLGTALFDIDPGVFPEWARQN